VESLDLFRQQETSWGVAWAVLSLGDVALDQGDAAQALVYFEEALALSQGDISSNAWALISLGRVAHVLGDGIRAQMHYAQCLPLFYEYGDRRGVAMVFLDLGRVAHAQWDEVKAHEYYAESLTIFGEFMDKLRLPECLEGIAGLAGATGRRPENVRRAVQLFGAAEALRASAGIPLPPIHRAAYEREVAAARAQLDEATFAAAWAAGRQLTLAQAVAYALGDED
jgi:tetratricopeptide (TPR) repeat protein